MRVQSLFRKLKFSLVHIEKGKGPGEVETGFEAPKMRTHHPGSINDVARLWF